MQVETKTRIKLARDGTPVVILDMLLLPRGSGNRNAARRLADAFRRDVRFKDHIRKISCGASRVTVHCRSSKAFLKMVLEMTDEPKDVPGQLAMFRPA